MPSDAFCPNRVFGRLLLFSHFFLSVFDMVGINDIFCVPMMLVCIYGQRKLRGELEAELSENNVMLICDAVNEWCFALVASRSSLLHCDHASI